MSELGLLRTTSLATVLYALLTIDAAYPNLTLIASSESGTHVGIDSENWLAAVNAMHEAAEGLERALATLG